MIPPIELVLPWSVASVHIGPSAVFAVVALTGGALALIVGTARELRRMAEDDERSGTRVPEAADAGPMAA